MDLELDGKTVLVAGASKGIGLGIAEGFLAEGAHVMLTARSEGPLAEVHERLAGTYGGRVGAFSGDMTDSSDIEDAINACETDHGPLDVLVANVGGGFLKPGWDLADGDIDAALLHNLTGTLRVVREGVKRMQGRGGSVVVISSIAGVDAMGAPLTYGIAKSGLNHYVNALARLVGPEIRVNGVAPGNIMFDGGAWDQAVSARPDAWQRWVEREVALQRFGEVREIADVVLFLASDRASFVTGATWIADGGQVRSTA